MHARYYTAQYARFTRPDPAFDFNPLNPVSFNLYEYSSGNPVNFIDSSGLTYSFENAYSEKMFDDYVSSLDEGSENYGNYEMLRDSEVNYHVSIKELTKKDTGVTGAEGFLGYNGESVLISTIGRHPNNDASFESRLAHEIQHGVQFEQGKVWFNKLSNGRWSAAGVDLIDEVEAYEAGLRSAQTRDLSIGTLRRFGRKSTLAEKKAFLVSCCYGRYKGIENEDRHMAKVPGSPGIIVRTSSSFYRTK
jgi:hypothetical protein